MTGCFKINFPCHALGSNIRLLLRLGFMFTVKYKQTACAYIYSQKMTIRVEFVCVVSITGFRWVFSEFLIYTN